MIAFLIGGEGRFMDAMINKLNKDGHRVYLLTGSKNSQTSYQKVFEKYNFEYDSDSIREILVSANPDVVIFMGAYDSRYTWEPAMPRRHGRSKDASWRGSTTRPGMRRRSFWSGTSSISGSNTAVWSPRASCGRWASWPN